jgi:hypothetical protein
MARENSGWGYDRIAGALANLGHHVSDQTVGNILRRYCITPAPKRRHQMSWADFIHSHMAVLAAIDFFTAEVLTWHGLATYYVLFFLHLETRRVTLAGITQHPTEEWMLQMARRAVDAIDAPCFRSVLFCTIATASSARAFKTLCGRPVFNLSDCQPAVPILNAFAERWRRSIKSECLSKLILFGQASLRRAVTHFIEHYHLERPHQGKGNQLLFPSPVSPPAHAGRVQCHERLGGLLKFY